jgi:polysaccharide export outer membrane protein
LKERIFSGTYKLDIDGEIHILYLDPLPIRGLEPETVEVLLTRMLIEEGFFQPEFLQVSVLVLQRAPIPVTVSGAVFNNK